jgi:hypothetical protein
MRDPVTPSARISGATVSAFVIPSLLEHITLKPMLKVGRA